MIGNAKNCDVLVAGGGIAGISAALSAARNGANVILVEKQCALGGLATLGMVTIYLPLCNGMGNQVIFGIGEELLRLSILDECQARYPKAWLENGTVEERKAKRFEVQYNPYLFALACEELLLNNGVRILYDCLITDVEMDGKRISAVNIHNKEGCWSIGVKAVVDGTGDGDICAFSGEETCRFTENRFAAWHYLCEKGQLRLSSYADSLSAPVPQHGRYYDGLDTDDITQMVIDGHRDILY